MSLLSENTGAHEELAEFALSVNPFDVQEQVDAIHRALHDVRRGALLASAGPQADRDRPQPGDRVDDQLADIEAKRHGRAPVAG